MDISARWLVPKMVKNGQNSAFAFANRYAVTKKTQKFGKFKTVIRPRRRIKTILGQFQDKAARKS